MNNLENLSRVAFKLYKNEGGNYFELDDVIDFMENEIDCCEGEDISNEELIRTVVRQMLEME